MRDGTGKLPTPDSHMYSENGAKIMVYNMTRHSKKKRGQEINREKERVKKHNSKKGKL